MQTYSILLSAIVKICSTCYYCLANSLRDFSWIEKTGYTTFLKHVTCLAKPLAMWKAVHRDMI